MTMAIIKKHFKLAVILLVFLILGCSPIPSYKTQTEEVIRKWDDAIKIASSTSRISLSTPVARLQEIKREAEKVKVSNSLKNCHQHLLNYMDLSIESFLVFMRDQEYASRDLIRKASNEMDEWVMCLNPILKKQKDQEEQKKIEKEKRGDSKLGLLMQNSGYIEEQKRQSESEDKTVLGKIRGLNKEAVRIILGDPISQEKTKKGEIVWGKYFYEGKTVGVYFKNGIVSGCSN